ncbi:WD repeat domain-containing protein [Xylariomycetidae sp. FL0641]|nr:WD repeat domain-containing protein [Xylariomycetidae sp. FL0641]
MAQYANSKLDRPEPGLIKWSPNPAYDSFIHVNLQYRVVHLYQPTGLAQRGRFEYEKISKLNDIPPLSTYDWSPAHPGFVAIGTASGTVNILNLNDESNHYLEQRLKFTRFCQAVAFNTGTLLAVGLERVRNDQCLQIWDVNRLANVDPSVSWSSLDGSILGDPVHRLEPATSVSSTKFFEDNPQTLVVGIKNQGIRIYDLRDPNGSVINFQTKCNNNLAIDYADSNYFASSSLDKPGLVIWDRRAAARPSSSPAYLEAVDSDNLPWGAALSLDKAIDINLKNVPERGSLIRAIRYCRDHRGLVAVLSRTGQLKVLDTQKEFSPPEKRFDESPELLETRRSYELDVNYLKENRKHDHIVSFDWLNLESPVLTPRVVVLRASGAYEILEKPSYTSEHVYKMVPWKAPYRGLAEGTRYHSLMQFESSQHSEMAGPLLIDEALKDIPLFGENRAPINDIVQQAVQFPPSDIDPIVDFEAKAVPLPATYATAKSTTDQLHMLRQYSKDVIRPRKPKNDEQQFPTIEDLDRSLTDLSMKGPGPPSNRQLHERMLATTLDTKGFPKEAQILLDHVMLLRAKERYLFDYAANREIVSNNPWLRDLWDWVAGATQAAADEGMIAHGIDFSYLGVATIWRNDLGRLGSARLTSATNLPSSATWERCFETINKKSGQPVYNGVESRRPAQRQAAMRTCRWGKSLRIDYSDYAKMPPSERTSSWHTMAAALALFEGKPKEAVQILKRASTEYPELLFVSLALQLIGRGDIGLAQEQLDFDDAVASKTDPYLRAISSLIATNNWEVIANQESLPLRERTHVALRYFDDDKLTDWLDTELEKAIASGDIEGLVLTGITDPLVDIFAAYVRKFGDVQTATLTLSICAPRYIDDYRCHAWRNAFRAYLQRHKAFLQRTKFEVESTKLSKRGGHGTGGSRDGIPTLKPPSRQVALRCVYCDAEYELSKLAAAPASSSFASQQPTSGSSSNNNNNNNSSQDQGATTTTTTTIANPLTATGVAAGVSCPTCGRHLPRCVVCLEVVGIPRSSSSSSSSNSSSSSSSSRPAGQQQQQQQQQGDDGRGLGLAARFPTFCLQCDHVLHLDHARLWFARHVECPVPECRCRCNFRANPELGYR